MAVTTYKPTINVPFAMRLKYVDVYPNNPENNYGPSLALRGDIEGQDMRVYPKGFLDANLGAMVNAGIIEAPGIGDFDYDPSVKYSLPVIQSAVTITLSQAAGQKHAKTVFLTANGHGAAQAQQQQMKRPRNIGTLPGDDDDYLDAVADEGATSPAQTSCGATSPHAGKLQQVQAQYASALDWVLANIVPKLSQAHIPTEAAAVNAMVATLLIGSKS